MLDMGILILASWTERLQTWEMRLTIPSSVGELFDNDSQTDMLRSFSPLASDLLKKLPQLSDSITRGAVLAEERRHLVR